MSNWACLYRWAKFPKAPNAAPVTADIPFIAYSLDSILPLTPGLKLRPLNNPPPLSNNDLNNSGASLANLRRPSINTTIVIALTKKSPFTPVIESLNIISTNSGTSVHNFTIKKIIANLTKSST